VGRGGGGRFFALGRLGVRAGAEGRWLRAAVLAGAGADLVDALALGHAASRGETKNPGIAIGALAGAAAAATGIWTARRI
jgi:hypothetical protein